MESESKGAAPLAQVGFVGLGSIGLPMATRLLECGVALIVTNRTKAKSDDLVGAGARWVDTPAELTARADVVLSCLQGPEIDRSVFLGDSGLLSVDAPGTLFVNTSTIGPDLAIELAGAASKMGATYLDVALMGGGPPSAAAGTLVLPVGGDPAVVEAAMPVLSHLASTIEHVGPVGAAQVVKLVNNSLHAANVVAIAQGLRFAVRAGVNPAALGRLLPIGSGRSYTMETVLPAMLEGRHRRGTSMVVLGKDVRLAAELGRAVGEEPTVAEAVAAAFARASAGGLEGWSHSAIVDFPSTVLPRPGPLDAST
jgi:3-hydroxyisobutyrate dehydrogenase-like beta-hydroxyacid dehydrogenase